MSALTFRLKAPLPDRLDVSPLIPERLSGLMVDQIRYLELWLGGQAVPAGELFDIDRSIDEAHAPEAALDPTAEDVRFESGDPRLDRLGAGMTTGRLTVHGSVGSRLAENVSGGLIRIHGSAGAYAGTLMSGGRVIVDEHVGDYLGGAWPGARHGLRGGRIQVGGDCGDRAGYRMRRGELLISGSAGSACGARMIAGTIAVAGRLGPGAAYAMRRGTILASEPPKTAAIMADCGLHEPVYLMTMVRGWQQLDPVFRFQAPIRYTRRLIGDRSVGGDGEILFPAR